VTLLSKLLERRAAPAWCFFGLALLVRLAAIWLVFRSPSYYSDERMYLRLADAVARGDLLGSGTYLTPGPIYLFGLGRALGLGVQGLREMQALLGAGAVALFFLTARRIFGPRLAGLAALVAAGYPYLAYLSGVFYAQSLFIFALSAVVYALLRFIQEGRARWLPLGGVALGVAALTVSPILVATPLLAIWLLVCGRGGPGRRVRSVAILAAVTLVTILPWTARNYVVTKRFVFISSMGSYAFYYVNNSFIDPYDRDADAWLVRFQERLNREQARQALTDHQMERVLFRRAQQFIFRHPDRALRNYLVRLSMFFDTAPRLWTANVHARSRATTIVTVATSLPVLLLAPLGLWFGRRRFRLWFPLVAITLVEALAYAFFQCSVRYRLPFEPWIILFAVVGLAGVAWPGLLKEEAGPLRDGAGPA
jgi:4-amino-4-deoxy-L-arabinose transferase-like glycosyltransferase